MTRYYTADLHLGHRLIADKRGFPSVRAHDAAIMAPLYSLTDTDELFVLGDLSCGGPADVACALD